LKFSKIVHYKKYFRFYNLNTYEIVSLSNIYGGYTYTILNDYQNIIIKKKYHKYTETLELIKTFNNL